MKIVVLGTVTLNGGDAAIAESQLKIIRQTWPAASVVMSDSQPESAVQYLAGQFIEYPWTVFVEKPQSRRPWRSIRRRTSLTNKFLQWRAISAARSVACGRRNLARLSLTAAQRHVLRQIHSADLVMWTGGTTLVEHYQLGPKFFDIEIARALGRPYGYFQQSTGPFDSEQNRRTLSDQFSNSIAVLLRDDRSLRHVIDLGVPPEICHVLPDTVFALEQNPPSLPKRLTSNRVRVAVSVRSWRFFRTATPEGGMQAYVQSISAAVIELIENWNADVVFVSTCQGRPEYWTDDSAVAETIAASLPVAVRQFVTVDRRSRTASELIDFFGDFDALIATRLHAGILGVTAGLPVLAIAYEFKSMEVWNQLGLADFVVDINDLTPEGAVQSTRHLMANRADARAALAESLPGMHEGALRAGEILKSGLMSVSK